MKIVSIFADTDANPPVGLFSVCLNAELNPLDEYENLLERFSDVEYLRQYFKVRRHFLQTGFYAGTSINDAIEQTLEESSALFFHIEHLANKGLDELCSYLSAAFQPLDNQNYRQTELQKSKAKGERRKSWLRLYAVKVAPNFFILTDGGIKLVRQMKEDESLLRELKKLERIRNFLIESELYFPEDYGELEW